MNRLHVSLAVNDLAGSVAFYTDLFAARPTVLKDDYARWMLEDPRVNFSVRLQDGIPGVAHLGIQAEDAASLENLYGRVQRASGPVLDEGETVCCYSRSRKRWTTDPDGIPWEAFLTHGDADQPAEQDSRTSPPGPDCCAGQPS